jgi:hypothetical protein
MLLERSATMSAAAPDESALTWVDLVWYEKRIEHWIRFGRTEDEQILDRRRRRVGFAPGAVFAFVRWQSGDRGTVASRLAVVQAQVSGAAIATLPGVTPGGTLLLRLSGWPKVQRALAAVDQVDDLGIDPADAAPDHWRQVHARLSVGQTPEPYSRFRHRAWRQRQELGL